MQTREAAGSIASRFRPLRKAAFTLIEVLAAVFLTALVMSVAISFFVNLSDSTEEAARKTRQGRQALAVLDRVARDLEGAYLVSKPSALDPLSHSWSFVAESEVGDSASDHVRFVSRSHRPRNRLDHGSDLAVINYALDSGDGAPGFDLLRSVSPGLPSDSAEAFHSDPDESFVVVAESVQHFGLYFMSEDLEWHDAWDSTQLEQSSALPRAAKIEIAYLPKPVHGGGDLDRADLAEGAARIYTRQVRLPMQAVNLAAILSEASKENAEVTEEEEDFEADEAEPPDDSQEQADLSEDLESFDLPRALDPSRLKREGRRLRRLENLR